MRAPGLAAAEIGPILAGMAIRYQDGSGRPILADRSYSVPQTGEVIHTAERGPMVVEACTCIVVPSPGIEGVYRIDLRAPSESEVW